jgi:carboxyl-terminal processing protease
LTSAIEVANAFIEDGVILNEQFEDTEQIFEANVEIPNYPGIEQFAFPDIQVPIVVLVDETSASASELLAGAMQDRGVAIVIGEVTFGKGTVQTWQPLVNGGGVRITIARWLTPNGNWIHEQGVTPDIIVVWNPQTVEDLDLDNDVQVQEALEYLEDPEGYVPPPVPTAEPTAEPTAQP